MRPMAPSLGAGQYDPENMSNNIVIICPCTAEMDIYSKITIIFSLKKVPAAEI